VAPVGETSALQELVSLERTGEATFERQVVTLVRFVPMTGEARARARR
jgi:protein-L-isoaspartate O-methyltransferase